MPTLTIQTGLFTDDLEKSMIEFIRSEKEIDPFNSVVVLVGSRLLGDYLINLLLTENSGLINTRFITISDLSRELDINRPISKRHPTMPALGEQIAVLSAINKLIKKDYFQQVKHTPGFRRSLKRLFRNLDIANLDFKDIFMQHKPDPTGKWQALSTLYANYSEILKPYQLSQDNNWEHNEIADSFGLAYDSNRLIVYGFYDFNPSQMRLIKALSRDINLNILMPYWSANDTQGTVFEYAKPIYDELHKLEYSQPIQSNVTNSVAYCTRLFRYNLDTIDVVKLDQPKPVAKLEVIRASGITVEINEIVGRINDLVLWQDTPIEKIAVILWQPDVYLEPLCTALTEADIPHCDLIGGNLSASPDAEVLRRILATISTSNINHAEMVDLFYLQPNEVTWGAIYQAIEKAEGSCESWLKAVEWYKDNLIEISQSGGRNHGSCKLFTLDHVISLSSFLSQLDKFHSAIPARNNILSYLQSLRDIIDVFLPDSKEAASIQSIIDHMSTGELVDSIIDWNVFVDMVNEAIAESPNKTGKIGSGVVIVDKMTCRGVIYDAVFLPGMVQGAIPAEPSENPVMTDHDRDLVFKGQSITNNLILPRQNRRRQEEKLLFGLAVDSARYHLTLSYSKLSPTQSGTSLPSRFLIDLCRVAHGKILSSEDIASLPFFADARADTEVLVTGEINSVAYTAITSADQFLENWIKSSYPINIRYQAYRKIYSGLYSRFRQTHASLQAKRNQFKLSPFDGILSIDLIEPTSTENILPVTGLEKYATCPFNYFIQSILRAQPWEEFGYDIQVPPPIIGNIIHRTLKQLYDRLLSTDSPTTDGQVVGAIIDAMEEILETELRRARSQCTVPQSVWTLNAASVKARLIAFIKDDLTNITEFKYSSGEEDISYKFSYNLPESGDVMLSGRIDRIDRTADGKAVQIIDYKTGSANAKPERLKGGTSLQLPLYLSAMFDIDKRIDPNSSNAQYLRILPDGSIKRHSINGEQLEQIHSSLDMTVGTINTLIHRGYFPPVYSARACDNCTSAPACHKISREKVANVAEDANLELIRTMREDS